MTEIEAKVDALAAAINIECAKEQARQAQIAQLRQEIAELVTKLLAEMRKP